VALPAGMGLLALRYLSSHLRGSSAAPPLTRATVAASFHSSSSTTTTAGASSSSTVDLRQPPFVRQPLFRPGKLEEFDREKYDRDGYYVFPDILTEWATQNFAASLRRLQGINDFLVMNTPWADVDWEKYNVPTPPGPFDAQHLRSICGGQERGMNLLPGNRRDTGDWSTAPIRFPDGVPNEGVAPHAWPQAYDEFLWDTTTLAHPDARALQLKLLGCDSVDSVRCDHIHMLNRRGPDQGRTWHAHPYDEDGFGVTEKVRRHTCTRLNEHRLSLIRTC
jgi:hypothetical protein